MGLKLEDFCVNYTVKTKYKQGVYKIYHLNDISKIYIGSASGTYRYGGFANRFSGHFRDLRINKHCNAKLQNYINKYGIEKLRFEIVEVCKPDECILREQYYINLHKPYFNIAKKAGNTLGYKHTVEYIKSVSTPILQYNLEGNFIEEFINTAQASDITGVKKTLIYQCCRNNKKYSSSTGGYRFLYKTKNTYPLKIDKYYYPQSKRILCYDKNGVFVKEYLSILEASNKLKIPTGNISSHLKNNTSICYGHVFRFYTEEYPTKIDINIKTHKNQLKVIIKNLNTKTIKEFKSFRDAASSGIIARSTLKDKLKKEGKSFVFKNKYLITIEKY